MPLSSPYFDNNATKAPASSVGFKLSKPGYDASRTAGQNFIFDSSWPSLPIAFDSGAITNPITSSTSHATIAHNLQFPPLVWGWAYYPDPLGIGSVSRRFLCAADKTNIYLGGNGNSSPPLNATKIRLRAFQLDLSKDVDYSLAPGDTFNGPYDPNFGVKVVKSGRDINSRDMRDFALHSRCQSPLILAVKTDQTSTNGTNNVVQYTSNLKYAVWVYGFIKLGSTSVSNLSMPINTYYPAPYYSQSYPKTFTDGFKSYIQWNASPADNGATLVILRDPMFASTQQAIVY